MNKLKEEQGASLIEILGAIIIISIIVVTVLNLSGFTSLSFIKSNDRGEALRTAEKELNKALEVMNSCDELPQSSNRITFSCTDDISNPIYPSDTTSSVLLQGFGTGEGGQQFLVTVTVFYGRE